AALAGQPAPRAAAGVDPRDLAAMLRRDAVEQVPLPTFGAIVSLCKTATGPRRDDCLALARRLVDDRSGALLARMVGSAMLRRLVRGTPEEAAAMAMRREYVWLAERLAAGTPAFDALQEDVAQYGEREALQRAVERGGDARTPPAAWSPADPDVLRLPE